MAVIAISRPIFCGGQSLAERVAQRLGYTCLTQEVFAEAAKLYDISEERLRKVVSEPPGILQLLHSERRRYLACLRATLLGMVKDGNVVYHGDADRLLLDGVPQVLRVRIAADMESRIRALIEQRNLSRTEATQVIMNADEKQAKWTRFYCRVDWRDSSLYDVVVDLGQNELSEVCDLICNAANTERYKTTPELRKLMNDLALSSALEAMIASTKGIWGCKDVTVQADGGVVTLEGAVDSLMDKDSVTMLVSRTPGVTQLDCRIRVRLFGGPSQLP